MDHQFPTKQRAAFKNICIDMQPNLEVPEWEDDNKRDYSAFQLGIMLWTLLITPHIPVGFGGSWSLTLLPSSVVQAWALSPKPAELSPSLAAQSTESLTLCQHIWQFRDQKYQKWNGQFIKKFITKHNLKYWTMHCAGIESKKKLREAKEAKIISNFIMNKIFGSFWARNTSWNCIHFF